MTKKALAKIRALAHGNGAEKDSISIVKNNGEMIDCEAITHIELIHEVKEERKQGQHQAGEIVENPASLPKIIEKLASGAIKNIDMRKAMADMLLSRPDKGFAVHAKFFELEPLNKVFSSFLPCQGCKADGNMACTGCNGQKVEQCSQCHGRTTISCTFCRGSGITKMSDGKEKQCNRCFGKRSVKCPRCQSRGTVSCRKCGGTGNTKCSICGGVGIFTLITTVKFKMKTIFEIDRSSLPHPAVKVIENNGSQLVEGEHIKIHGEAVKREDGGLAIQYAVRFPYADMTVGVNGKPIKVHMFGFKAKMLKISTFLNQLIEKDYALLIRAANNDGNIVSHLRKASKTRMIGEGLLLSVTMRPKKAMMALKKKFPVGASNQIIKDIVLESNKALINVSRKSHLSGLGVGLAVTAILNIAYFFAPLRDLLSGALGETIALTATDFLLIPLGGVITMLISQHMAASPLKKALCPLMPEDKRKTFKPLNHNSQWPAYVGSALIFIFCISITTITSATTPSWFLFE